MHDCRAQLERLPDGSLRATLYRDGQPERHEWVRSRRRGRRRVADLLCSAIDTDLDALHRRHVAAAATTKEHCGGTGRNDVPERD